MTLVTTDLSGNGPSGHSPKVPVEVIEGEFTGTGRSASFRAHNYFNLSLSGFGTATVTLDRSFDNGTTWKIVTSYTSDTEQQVDEPEEGVIHSVNCSSFNSGPIIFRLSNSK